MYDPTGTGVWTDDGGVARCRRSGKRCLSYRQAVAAVSKSVRREAERQRYHCGACGWWHQASGRDSEPAERPRRRKRAKTRARPW